MKVLFYLGHPAHFHLFKNLFTKLIENGTEIKIVIKTKDILEHLLIENNYKFINIYDKERKDNKLQILYALIEKDIKLFNVISKYKPNYLLGTSIEITHIGKLLNIPSIVVNEDDFDVVPEFAILSYPFATKIIAPYCCKVGKIWENKRIGYNGYHELAYLHPKYYKPKKNYNINKYIIIRMSALNAYHDKNISGMTLELVKNIINKVKKEYFIFISYEGNIPEELKKYQLKIKYSEIHDFIYYASLVVSDSQTMSAEAAVLGTPSLRYNDFVGRINYLEELEHKYGLTFGFRKNEQKKLLDKLDDLLIKNNLKEIWKEKRNKMLSEVDDLNEVIYNELR